MNDESLPADDGASRSDDDLLRASRAGDEEALESLLTRYYTLLQAFIRARMDPALRARESVSDVTQSVCRELLRRAEEFEFRSVREFRAFLCKAALNKLRDRADYHRALKRDVGRETPTGESENGTAEAAALYRTSVDPQGKAIRSENLAALQAALENLPPEMREVLVLRSVYGLSYDEIAELVGGNVASLRKLTQRARARLVERLRPLRDDD